MILFDPYALE